MTPSKFLKGAATAIGVLLLVLGTWWASRATLEENQAPTTSTAPTTYTVVEQTIERSTRLVATVEWRASSVADLKGTGTITTIDLRSGDVVDEGSPLLTIDLLPVIAGMGTIPAFRDLSSGAEGADVQQLQDFLTRIGFYEGPADGVLGSGTVAAIREWERSLDLEPTGVVPASRIAWFPQLPAKVRTASQVQVGAFIDGRVEAFEVLEPAPSFTIRLDGGQRQLIPPEADAVVHFEETYVWSGTVGTIKEVENGIWVYLETSDGGPLCADDCGAIPANESLNLPVDLIDVPPTVGPVVPIAAIMTDPSGKTFVVATSGQPLRVEILAQADGLAVVSGVEIGTEIILDASDQ